jgi:hypothetical protein
MVNKCLNCQREIEQGEEYFQHSDTLCEDCYFDLVMPRTRKTHWQYLSSIKTDYLRPAKREKYWA